MSYDIVIRSGTIVDGTGRPAYQADVAIVEGVIAAIGPGLSGARRIINASNLVVTPGFIDPHTHYDGQICWDPLVSCSSWHGITTVIMGNCGVGLAPCKPAVREVAAWDLVNVEAIPFEVLKAGVSWDWESFPQYMDAAQRRGSGINLGFLAALTPFRHYVMGEASMDRAANGEETARIRALLKEAIAAGALGFTLSTAPQHIGYQGRPLACRLASLDELRAYAGVLKELGKGTIEAIVTRHQDRMLEAEYRLLELLLTESGRPVTWLSLRKRLGDPPDGYQEVLRMAAPLIQRGALPQISNIPLITGISLRTPPIQFAPYPSWKAAFNAGADAQKRTYADPAFRQAFRIEMAKGGLFKPTWDLITVSRVGNPALKSLELKTVAEIAQTRGKDPFDTFFDLALEDNLDLEYVAVRSEVTPELLDDPRTLLGISDGGAHVDQLCSAGYPTDLIGTWVRDQGVLSLERAVARMTSHPADFFGLRERGRLLPGMAADVVVFDYDRIACRRPELRHDLPGGGRRLVSKASGVRYTLVNGQVLYEDEVHSGALPGRVLRA